MNIRCYCCKKEPTAPVFTFTCCYCSEVSMMFICYACKIALNKANLHVMAWCSEECKVENFYRGLYSQDLIVLDIMNSYKGFDIMKAIDILNSNGGVEA